ncbi:hypothetical protein H310_05300 [Aphanomyces invadans]|uniref:Peptidase S1 domain-containing protein n=1 Tax=Aphanomyces invadans TaxID=157072 RepID=A0A024U9C5_9STRA|nr:hypothetical protein H310_05300 [Aphanomyces invadans]ETW02815.1 hypothetical protein H310_05300 [Aphanomyces invadans]|eukprot:XP_008868199.1 hypothetical protein H310_05300 [Aphanomyces invadans]
MHEYVSVLQSGSFGRNLCGGSLIATNVILTAASCKDQSFDYVSIGSDSVNTTSDGERIKVKETFIHPKYNAKTGSNDVAVMLLERHSKFTPVKVSYDVVEAGTPTIVRGWGTQHVQFAALSELRDVTVSNDQCARWMSPEIANESVVCVGGKGGKEACLQGPGYPLTVQDNGSEKMVGLVSRSTGCTEVNTPVVYTRLSMIRDFVEPFVNNTATPSPLPRKPVTQTPITTSAAPTLL